MQVTACTSVTTSLCLIDCDYRTVIVCPMCTPCSFCMSVCVSEWLCDKSVICDSTCERTMRAPCICWWREGKRVRLEPILEVMTIHPLCFCSLSYNYNDERKRSLIIYQAALYLIIQIALPTKRIIFLQCGSVFGFFYHFFFSFSVLCVTSLKMICTAGSVRRR